MSDFDIRPHHGLCTAFFIGKGYDTVFVDNMAMIIDILESKDPTVKLVSGTDIICQKCPDNTGGKCSGTKADIFDSRVLDILGIQKDTELKWNVFRDMVRQRIIESGRLAEVCADCQWFSICENIARPYRKKMSEERFFPESISKDIYTKFSPYMALCHKVNHKFTLSTL